MIISSTSLLPPAKPKLPTVPKVDLTRYAGLWHELARLPTRFQDSRTVSTAQYTPRPDGKVTVDNRSYLGDEQVAGIMGTAASANPGEDTRLKVRFGGFLKLIPVPRAGNYYVLDLAPDYSLALVGSPDRKMLWLLGRSQDGWDTARAAEMVQRAQQLGFDTSKLLVADWTTRRMRP